MVDGGGMVDGGAIGMVVEEDGGGVMVGEDVGKRGVVVVEGGEGLDVCGTVEDGMKGMVWDEMGGVTEEENGIGLGWVGMSEEEGWRTGGVVLDEREVSGGDRLVEETEIVEGGIEIGMVEEGMVEEGMVEEGMVEEGMVEGMLEGMEEGMLEEGMVIGRVE